jgi:hypothetical protein
LRISVISNALVNENILIPGIRVRVHAQNLCKDDPIGQSNPNQVLNLVSDERMQLVVSGIDITGVVRVKPDQFDGVLMKKRT